LPHEIDCVLQNLEGAKAGSIPYPVGMEFSNRQPAGVRRVGALSGEMGRASAETPVGCLVFRLSSRGLATPHFW